jgi:hypothetical protein
MYWATPVMVPPVPVPETRMSTLPSVSFQISGPVVAEVNGGIGGVGELLRDEAVRRLGQNLLGLGDGALHAVGAGGQHDLRAKGQQQHAALQAHGLRQGEDQPVALDGGHKGQRDAGVAAGRLDQHGLAGGDLALLLGGLDQRQADAVLYAGYRVLALQLDHHGCGQSGSQLVQPHQRGPANEFRYIRGNARHNILLFPGCFPGRFRFNCFGVWCNWNSGKAHALSGHTFASELAPGRC